MARKMATKQLLKENFSFGTMCIERRLITKEIQDEVKRECCMFCTQISIPVGHCVGLDMPVGSTFHCLRRNDFLMKVLMDRKERGNRMKYHKLQKDINVKKSIAFICDEVNKQFRQQAHKILCGAANGYVAVPPRHPLHGKKHEDVDMSVHGGLTYSSLFSEFRGRHVELINKKNMDVPDDWWVFGFDTMHFGDTPFSWPKERVIEETLHLQEQLERMSFDAILEANRDVLKRLKEK